MSEPHPTDPAAALAERKTALRRELLAIRARLDPAWRAGASATIVATVAALPELADARAALGYAATGSEVNIDALLRTWLVNHVALHLPFVAGDDLGVAPVGDLDADCVPGWGGVREPDPQRRRPVDPSVLDVAIVPGVAFDDHGHRLGYGGGHFDRLLARLAPSTPVIGVAFATQVVEQLPVGEHDQPVRVLVTEQGPQRPAGSGLPRQRGDRER